MMFSLKSPSFQNEKEWRLVYMIEKTWKQELRNFKISNNIVTPYLNTYLCEGETGNYKFPLDSIKIGPMLNEIIAKKSLKIFLENNINCSLHPIKISQTVKISNTNESNI
jgi:hypothetical protein